MAKKIEILKTSREFPPEEITQIIEGLFVLFPPEEITQIIEGLFVFMNDKDEKGNIFVNDYLILEKQLLHSDIEVLKKTNETFYTAFKNGMQIEETKLKKFAAADRLNASFVKEILNRDHNTNSY